MKTGSLAQTGHDPTPTFADTLRWWELRRIAYNLALTAMAIAIVIRTWPHFRPAIAWGSLPPLLILAFLANVCYSSAYAVEFFMSDALVNRAWRRWRWALWALGTAMALLFEAYWILDEIYPAVPFTG